MKHAIQEPALSASMRKKQFVFGVALFLAFALGLGALVFTASAEYNPKVWVESYGSQDTSKITSSQLLEVKTSGFADNACLVYFYKNGTYTLPDNALYKNVEQINRLYIFPDIDTYTDVISLMGLNNLASSDLYVGDDIYDTVMGYDDYVNNNTLRIISTYSTGEWTTSHFFALTYREQATGSITVWASDCNPDSATYGKSVSYSFTPQKADLGEDLTEGVAVMFAGETLTIRKVLARLGVPHLSSQIIPSSSNGTKIYDFTLKTNTANLSYSTQEYNGALNILDDMEVTLNPKSAGYITAYVEMKAGTNDYLSNLFYYNTFLLPKLDSYTSYVRIEVYDHKPTVKTYGYKIEFSDTIAGYTYTVGDVAQTATVDGQVLTFGSVEEPLLASIKYNVSMSSNNSNHLSKYDWQVYNSAPSTVKVSFDLNTATAGVVGSSTVSYNQYYNVVNEGSGYISENTNPGYDFVGWAENPDGTGTMYSDGDGFYVKIDTTLYAIWQPRTYQATVTVLLNSAPSTGDTVSLWQGGYQWYTLTEDSSGTYTHTAVQYQNPENETCTYAVYVNGVDTGQTLQWAATDQTGTFALTTVFSYDVTINVQYNGVACADRSVTLQQGTTTQGTSYRDGVYYLRNYYTTAMSATDGLRNIYIDGVQAYTGDAATTVAFGGDTSARSATITLYDLTVNVTINGNASGNSAATVWVSQNAQTYTLSQTSDGAAFTATHVIDNSSGYAVYVSGFYSANDTKITAANGNSPTVAYFTVQFVDPVTDDDGKATTEISKTYQTLTVQNGTGYPILGRVSDSSRSFSHWSVTPGGNAISEAFGEEVIIDGKTIYYAAWAYPSVIIGDYVQHAGTDGQADDDYYTMPYLVILGYNESAGSIFQLQISTTSSDSTITVPDGITPDGMTVTGSGSSTVVCNMPSGITPAEAEAFLQQLQINPAFSGGTPSEHTCTVDVWGLTV